MLYFIIFLYLTILGVKHLKYPTKKIKLDILFVLLIFILLAGLRYEIGYDYFAYREYYEECKPISLLLSGNDKFLSIMFNGWEPGVVLFLSLLKEFFCDPQIVFFSSSVICSLLLFKSLKKFCDSKTIFFSLLMYFSFVYMYQEMHALRQALGASVFYYALSELAKGKKNRAFALTVAAGCFHYSLLLFVPLIFLMDKRYNRKFEIIILISVLVIFVCRIRWIVPVINYCASILPSLGIVSKLLAYTLDDSFERPFFITFVLYLMPYLYILKLDRRRCFSNTPYLIIAKNLYFLYLIFTMIFWEFSFFSIRYGWICLFGMAICLPKLLEASSIKKSFVVAYIVLFSFIPISTFLFPDVTTGQFSPYEGYISRKIFGIKGTGRERVEQYAREMGVVFRF